MVIKTYKQKKRKYKTRKRKTKKGGSFSLPVLTPLNISLLFLFPISIISLFLLYNKFKPGKPDGLKDDLFRDIKYTYEREKHLRERLKGKTPKPKPKPEPRTQTRPAQRPAQRQVQRPAPEIPYMGAPTYKILEYIKGKVKINSEDMKNVFIFVDDVKYDLEDFKISFLGRNIYYPIDDVYKTLDEYYNPKKCNDEGWCSFCDFPMNKQCFNKVKHCFREELKSTYHILKILVNSIINDDKEIYIHIKKTGDLNNDWENDKNYLELLGITDSTDGIQPNKDNQGKLLYGLGPPASGKTFWAKQICDIFENEVFLTIDGGVIREQSEAYQTIIVFFEIKTKNKGLSNIVKNSKNLKHFFDNTNNKKSKKSELIKFLIPGDDIFHNFNLYIPEANPYGTPKMIIDYGKNEDHKKYCSHGGGKTDKYYHVNNSKGFVLPLFIYQHLNHEGDTCPFIEGAKCMGTEPSGRGRELKDGRPYQPGQYKPSYYAGIDECLKFKDNWDDDTLSIFIHNSGQKDQISTIFIVGDLDLKILSSIIKINAIVFKYENDEIDNEIIKKTITCGEIDDDYWKQLTKIEDIPLLYKIESFNEWPINKPSSIESSIGNDFRQVVGNRTIFLVRHGFSCANLYEELGAFSHLKKFKFARDPHLTKFGIKVGEGLSIQVHKLFNEEPIICSSILLRSQETALSMFYEYINKNNPLTIIPHCNETIKHKADLDNMSRKSIWKKFKPGKANIRLKEMILNINTRQLSDKISEKIKDTSVINLDLLKHKDVYKEKPDWEKFIKVLKKLPNDKDIVIVTHSDFLNKYFFKHVMGKPDKGKPLNNSIWMVNNTKNGLQVTCRYQGHEKPEKDDLIDDKDTCEEIRIIDKEKRKEFLKNFEDEDEDEDEL